MRTLILGLGLTGLLLSTGCSGFQTQGRVRGPDRVQIDRGQPSSAAMVNYLNENARRIPALRCEDMTLDCVKGRDKAAISSVMVCQGPRNFRLLGKALGKNVADIGSNDQEFWFWISEAKPPYVYHCAYADLERGKVNLPFPIQPEMILAGLGMAQYDPAKQYQVKVNGRTVELIETVSSPHRGNLQKVTVFARGPVGRDQPQVIGHILRDERGKEICSATITHVQTDPTTGAVLPRRMKFRCPAEQFEMSMRLDGARVIRIEQQQAASMFSRANLTTFQGYDLARRTVDQPAGQVQRAGLPPR
jgi:hypothetical protein